MIQARTVLPNPITAIGVFAMIALAVLLLGGCSSYNAPTLKVAEARVTEQTAQGTVLSFTLDAENSNAVELPLREIRYTLDLEGQRVFEGFRSPEATIRRFAVQRVTLPAVVSVADAARLNLNLVTGGTSLPIRYKLAGTLTYLTPGEIEEILFDNEIRRPTVSFEDSGEITLSSVPAGSEQPTAPK